MRDNSNDELEEGEEVSENQQSSQFIVPKSSGRKELCDVCNKALYKYTCPRCKVKSCGVTCLNTHKKSKSCTGVSQLFSPLLSKNIEEKQVQKDYLFVKDMLSSADKVKKTLTGVDSIGQEPKRFKIMRMNAKRLYNMTILNAPSIIERHRQNISFYFVKTKTFYWIVEILFWRQFKGSEICSRIVTSPQPDSKQIKQLIPQDFLCREMLQKGINTQKIEEFKVFIERKNRGTTKKQAVEVEKQSLLRDCLINQTVYEFPTLIFVHESLVKQYLSHKTLPQIAQIE